MVKTAPPFSATALETGIRSVAFFTLFTPLA